MNVKIGVSNRHVHLKKSDLEILFGEGYELNLDKNLTQPGQFASKEFVTLEGSKGRIEHVRVLGPLRDYTQVEISLTDSYKLGVKPPVRNSGDLKNSSPIKIIGPKGELDLSEGCIIANRHIHISESDLLKYGFSNNQEVSVLIPGEKSGIINHVFIKASTYAYFELHLDTDDANAHLVNKDTVGVILK